MTFARAPYVLVAAQVLKDACHITSCNSGDWTDPTTGGDRRENPLCFRRKLNRILLEAARAINVDDRPLPLRREAALAAAVVSIFDLAGAYGLDIEGAIVEKLQFNQVRPDHQITARQADGGKAY